jgi:phosphoglycerol transferase
VPNVPQQTGRRVWPDLLAVILLFAVITAAWCNANAMWNREAWNLPSAYIGPYQGPSSSKSDVLLHLAFIRAARDGHFVPFCSKIVPELGAPYDGNWNDWPITEELPIYTMGLMARAFGIFAALNLALLACHVLAGLTFYFVSRYRGVCMIWSFTAALAFGLASYIFSQSPDHVLVALCWHVPLFLLVWNWVASEAGVEPGSKRFWLGMVVGLLAGLLMPYYAGIFCQLVLLGGLAMFVRNRSWPRLLSPICFVGATAFAFALMNVDTWVYRLKFGPNPGALVRPYQWLEVYGLKLVDLITPPLNHRWEAFRSFAQWRAQTQIVHDEGSYFGIIGVAAFLLLAGFAIRALCKRDSSRLPKEAWQVLWIFVFFTTGGLNAIGGLFGFTLFRAGCRFSVVILAISLFFAAEFLTRRMGRHIWPALAIGLLCCLVILLDQVPAPAPPEERAIIARQISSDQRFVTDIESIPSANAPIPLVPAKEALVFQLPVMDFPESPLRDVSAYDHLRPYLYSHHLRFSFGSTKGRSREQWQHDLTNLSLPDVIAELKKRGFGGLYVNRNAYPDKARGIEENLRALGYDRKIDSTEGDLFYVPLDSAAF